MNKLMNEDNKFSLINLETVEKGARYVKYIRSRAIELNPTSIVPIAGMDSGEWEKFRLWMQLDPVMYRLKTSTS